MTTVKNCLHQCNYIASNQTQEKHSKSNVCDMMIVGYNVCHHFFLCVLSSGCNLLAADLLLVKEMHVNHFPQPYHITRNVLVLLQ